MANHRHRWKETNGPETGCGAEYFFECSCGASKYVCIDQGERTEQITEASKGDDE